MSNSRAMRDGVLPKVLKLGHLANQAGVIKQHESVLVFSSGSILRNIVSPANRWLMSALHPKAAAEKIYPSHLSA